MLDDEDEEFEVRGAYSRGSNRGIGKQYIIDDMDEGMETDLREGGRKQPMNSNRGSGPPHKFNSASKAQGSKRRGIYKTTTDEN
jgi:hypothetical protein